jgi:hypothetical protein
MTARSRTQRVADSSALQAVARVGLVAYGVVHVLIAWLALQLAWGGGSSDSASKTGALATLAAQPGGRALLWLLTLGLVALALWQAGELLHHLDGLQGTGEERKDSVGNLVGSLARVVVYAALAVTAGKDAAGGSAQSSSSTQQQGTSGLFGVPGGRILVGIGALVIVGIGVYQIVKALRRSFLDEVDLTGASARTRELTEKLGMVGGAVKGFALGVVGGLFGWAAITFDPAKAQGLGGAMATILSAPFGRILLTLVALGFLAYGGYCAVRARFPARSS